MEIIYGERITRTASLRVAACAVIWYDDGRVLLTKRTDNGLWCLPGGAMDPGESAGECVIREVAEETGLAVSISRLVGVYTDPHWIAVYADGNRWALVVLSFECVRTGGTLGLSDETTDVGYFSPDALPPLVPTHYVRIEDARVRRPETIFS